MRQLHPVVIVVLISALTLTGCASGVKHNPVPHELADAAIVPGMAHVRTWGDGVSEAYKKSLIDSILQEEAYLKAHPELKAPESVDLLLISGGGENGAFGAGLLNGWTAAGDRPSFKLVTGVSTGALIAPFAFLGPKYDAELRKLYTGVTSRDILKKKGMVAILTSDSAMDTAPLGRLIAESVTPEALAEIAAEHAKGRRLLIGTVNLDAQRPVIWDMGAIAAIGTPESEKLFETVMLASASIPGAFPPQYIGVEADGRPFDEMHVDGGTVTQVFLWGAGFSGADARKALGRDPAKHRPARMFIIRNGVFRPEYHETAPKFASIAGRAVSTLIKAGGVNDMFRLYLLAEREGGRFNLAYIPESFNAELEEPFDTEYMKALYQVGYDLARAGYPWSKAPPLHGLQPTTPDK